jgi:hypothetical protein
MDEITTDVSTTDASSVAAEPSADSSPAVTPNEATQPQAETEEAAAPSLVPENDDDLQGQENNPHVQAVKQLRGELRNRDGEWKPWKEVVSTIGDPTLARDYHEAITALRTPIEGKPGEYDASPGLEKLESISPGIVNDVVFAAMNYRIADDKGFVDTMDRHYLRSLGLDPDRTEDYRNIDTIRASGAVTSDDLAGIPERFHGAFRALSSAQRDDFMLQKDANGQYSLASMEYLQDKAEALEARQWREQQAQSQQQAAQQQQQAFEAQLNEQIVEDVTAEAQSVADSILENLSSQVTFSSDPVQDELAKAGIMALISQVQSPYPYQQQRALSTLKKAGIELNGFGELLNRFEERRMAYKRFEAVGDQLQARRALSEYTIAKQQVLAKGNDYALRLAKANGDRVAQAASQQNGQLAAATARYVPSGSQVQSGSKNPYENNPHPVGSQEYYSHIRKVDKELGVGGAAMWNS